MDKKISFGFSKLAKKPQLLVPVVQQQKDEQKIEFIECLEGQSIKIAGKVEDEPVAPLVIPMTANTTPLEKVKQLREEQRERGAKDKGPPANGTVTGDPPANETLEQRAAREIIENIKATEDEEEAANNFTVPLKPDEVKLGGAKASTMDDYENVPIANFGLAMLRGMGWKDEEHKEKKKKGPEDDIIVCRPKGLGLGADKAMKQQVKLAATSTNGSDEKLVMKKGAYVRVLAGRSKDFYGQVEGLDEESGRVFIKMALGGQRESVNEAFVQLVAEKEYKENRKVLNVSKYEEYKKKEGGGGGQEQRKASDDRKKDYRDEDKYSERGSKRAEDYYSDDKRSSNRDERSSYKHTSNSSSRRDRRSRTRSPEQSYRRKESSSKGSKDYRSDRDRDRDDEGRSSRDKRRERSRSRDGGSSSRKYDDYRESGRRHDDYRSSKDSDRRRDRR